MPVTNLDISQGMLRIPGVWWTPDRYEADHYWLASLEAVPVTNLTLHSSEITAWGLKQSIPKMPINHLTLVGEDKKEENPLADKLKALNGSSITELTLEGMPLSAKDFEALGGTFISRLTIKDSALTDGALKGLAQTARRIPLGQRPQIILQNTPGYSADALVIYSLLIIGIAVGAIAWGLTAQRQEKKGSKTRLDLE